MTGLLLKDHENRREAVVGRTAAVEQMRSYWFSVGVGVRFRFMAGVIMLVVSMIPLVFMLMVMGSFAMRMFVVVLMGMIVTMVMDMYMAMFHVPMRMLVVVIMRVIVIMQMVVFVFSFHHQSSCTAGY